MKNSFFFTEGLINAATKTDLDVKGSTALGDYIVTSSLFLELLNPFYIDINFSVT